MSNTYTQIYIHIVFAVKGRQNLIPKEHKTELHGYIMGIIKKKKQTVIQINSMPDHIHILVGITPDTPVSNLVRDIKANSSKFIVKSENKFTFHQGTNALPPLARFVTSPSRWCIGNYGIYYINQKRWVMGRFEWQVGFGAFSYSRSHLDALVKYIKNQEKHHMGKTFREEYLEILERFNVNYNERYIFDPVEEDTEI